MLFYGNVAPLDRQRHRNLRLKALAGDFSFVAKTPLVPLAGGEFFSAAAQYPVLFSGPDEEVTAVAVLGVAEGSNLFVDAEGHWAPGVHVPAFVRRYPFVIANAQESGEFTVCIDDTWKGFGEQEGERLLDDEGKPTEFLNRVVDFIKRYQSEMLRTQTFITKLRELELLTRRDLQFKDPSGSSLALKDFQVVDEDRLTKLDDTVVGELHRGGWLPWIYAHLYSLSTLPAMHQRLRQRGLQPANA